VTPLLSLVLGWLATGFGAVVGSIVGNAGGQVGLAFGAIAGGVLGVLVAVNLARRLSWVPSSEAPGAAWLLIAATVAIVTVRAARTGARRPAGLD
jgi:hypothetical protein